MNYEGYWRRVCKIHYLTDERLAREREAVGSYKNAGLALLKRDLRMGYDDLRYRFYPALEQRWLDSLAYMPKDGVWIQHSIWSKQDVTNLYIGAPCS